MEPRISSPLVLGGVPGGRLAPPKVPSPARCCPPGPNSGCWEPPSRSGRGKEASAPGNCSLPSASSSSTHVGGRHGQGHQDGVPATAPALRDEATAPPAAPTRSPTELLDAVHVPKTHLTQGGRGDPGGRTSLDAGLARAHPAPTGSRAIAASRAQSPGLPGPRPALPGSRPTPRPPAPGASLSPFLAALSKGDLRGLCPPSAATAGLPGLRLLWVTGESTAHSPAPRRPPHTSAARRREASTEAAAASSSFRR